MPKALKDLVRLLLAYCWFLLTCKLRDFRLIRGLFAVLFVGFGDSPAYPANPLRSHFARRHTKHSKAPPPPATPRRHAQSQG